MRNPSVDAALRTARRRVVERTERNDGESSLVALDIGQLISPLRLDVLVRASLFETWAANWAEVHDRPDVALSLAQSHTYRHWFDLVAKDKITGGDTSSADEAFAWRVRRSHALLRGYMQDGFDERYPITVKMHTGGRLATGKLMGPRIYPVDGCHRLALLWVDGIRTLAPSHYRVLSNQAAPRDNTAALLPVLKLTTSDYFDYIGLGYGLSAATNSTGLLCSLSAHDPRRSELESVLTTDQALR